jgi:hypothetical protein
MQLRRFHKTKFFIAASFSAAIVFLSLNSAHAGEWREHEAHLMAFVTKIGGLQKEINQMIEERSKAGGEERQKIDDSLVKKWADLKKTNDDMEAEKLHIRFKHPEKGDAAERKYSHFQIKSLSEMESDMGIDGRLDRIKKKVEAKFDAKPEPSRRELEDERKPASTKQPNTDRITLKK